MILPHSLRLALASLSLFASAAFGFAADAAKPVPTAPVLKFADVEYLHRWTQDDQHEFTPAGQEDLEKWTEMLTLQYYRTIKDGEALANAANTLLETYKQHRAIVVRTDAVPRTPDKPAEYLMVVLLPTPDLIEAVFARLKISDGVGSAIIYSHREYGKDIGNKMSAWLQKNGPALEPALMSWSALPPIDFAKPAAK